MQAAAPVAARRPIWFYLPAKVGGERMKVCHLALGAASPRFVNKLEDASDPAEWVRDTVRR
jgi:hypothetical protein